MNVKSRISRTLKHLKNYHDLSEEVGSNSNWLHGMHFRPDEICYGVYKNDLTDNSESIIFTNSGIYFFNKGEYKFIEYNQMRLASLPVQKQGANEFVLHLIDGETLTLPIKGGSEKFRDVFEVIRFFNRVIGDLQHNSNPHGVR